MAWTHFLIETPFIVHRHIAGHATRVSHPKNMRSEVIQNSFKFKVCTLIFFPCKRFRKSDFQNVEFWNLKKDQHASTHVRDTYVTGTCGGLNFSMPTPIHTHSDISVETFEFLLQALVSIDVISARFKICVLPRVKAWGVESKHVLHHVTSVNIVFVFVNSIVCVWMFISSVTKSERQIERVRSKHVPPHVTSVVGCLHFQPSSENAVTDVWTCSWLKRQTKVSLKYSNVPQSVSNSKCQ